MTDREDIIRMAWGAGFGGLAEMIPNAVERFFHMAQAAQLEACAQICDGLIGTHATAKHCADAIRARGEK